MASFLDPPLTARTGVRLKILAICRISGPNQDIKSLDDQEAAYRHWIEQHTDLPFDVTTLAGRGSGEYLDREEYLRAIELVEGGTFDLLITEDLGRICRRVHAVIFCENCEDHDTRLIALNDFIDTGCEDWRQASFFAVMRHEAYNRDTAKRIRRTLRNRFTQGGVFQVPIYGYLKPVGAKKDDDISKDPSAEPIYTEWFRRLERGASYAEIADWLNHLGIPIGPYCRSQRWTGPMVGRLTHNPILKGIRVRNDKISRRINKTGRRRAIKAPPSERLQRHCPHLAFFEAEDYDRVVRIADLRNSRYRRKSVNGTDPRKNVSKKRTVWPGQHLRCGICGRICYWTGVASRKMMMCSGAQTYRCWNSVLLNGGVTLDRLSAALWSAIEALPELDTELMNRVRQQMETARDAQAGEKRERQARLAEVRRQIRLATDALLEMRKSRSLHERLQELETEQEVIEQQLLDLDTTLLPEMAMPSVEAIKRRATELFSSFLADDPEVGRLMQRLVPKLKVLPYRLCDDGAVVLRAHTVLNLAAFLSKDARGSAAGEVLRRELVIDLFDPPQRVKYREQVMALRGKLTERGIASRLGITQPAVQRAAALDRRMKAMGLTDPYLSLHEPPDDYPKLRRHRHPRYRFEVEQDEGS